MSKLPFPNLYRLRTVSESDSKPCFICYKPTQNVLITSKSAQFTKLDFFYVCKPHLDDAGFCNKRYITDQIDDVTANRDLEAKLSELQKFQFKAREKMTKLEKSIEESNSQLSKIMNYFQSTKKSDETKPKKDAEETKKEVEDDKSKLASAKTEYETITKEISELQRRNCKYQLDKSYYHLRLKKFTDAEKYIKQQQNLQNPEYFPSVSHLPKPE